MENEKQTITICERHSEYQTPIIFTMAFPGAECFCPYCTLKGDMFYGKNVESTPELEERKKIYQEHVMGYIRAIGTQNCVETKWEGKYITPDQLPQEEKDRLQKIRDKGWPRGVTAEELASTIQN